MTVRKNAARTGGDYDYAIHRPGGDEQLDGLWRAATQEAGFSDPFKTLRGDNLGTPFCAVRKFKGCASSLNRKAPAAVNSGYKNEKKHMVTDAADRIRFDKTALLHQEKNAAVVGNLYLMQEEVARDEKAR